MKEKFDIHEVAVEYGLDVIETTTDRGGYPRDCKFAIIGFEDFEEAEELAGKYGLRITTFFKRDGWALWVRNSDNTYGPMHINSYDYGDNYHHYYCSDASSFYENEIAPCLMDFDNLDELEAFLCDKRKLLTKIEDIDDSQIVISYQGNYYETININSMAWAFDTKNYVIGAIKD